jgi:hypothetical protein
MIAACHRQREEGAVPTGGESSKSKAKSSREAQIRKLKSGNTRANRSFGTLNFELPLSFELCALNFLSLSHS